MSSLGWIAFILDPTTRMIHIGFADRAIAAHLATLQRVSDHQLMLLGTMGGTRADLRQLDLLFHPVGGWCPLTPALWTFISRRTETTRAFMRLPRP